MSGNVVTGLIMVGLIVVSALIVITNDQSDEDRTMCIAGYKVFKHSGFQVISEGGGGVPCTNTK